MPCATTASLKPNLQGTLGESSPIIWLTRLTGRFKLITYLLGRGGGGGGRRRRGRHRKCWMDIKEWTALSMPELLTMACSPWPPARKTWRGSLLNHPSCPPPPNPTSQSVKGLNWTVLLTALHRKWGPRDLSHHSQDTNSTCASSYQPRRLSVVDRQQWFPNRE